MKVDDFFGTELAEEIRELLTISFQLDDGGKQIIVDSLHRQIEVNDSQSVKDILNRLADIIEKKEVSR